MNLPPVPASVLYRNPLMLAFMGSVAHGMWMGRDSIDDIRVQLVTVEVRDAGSVEVECL